MLLGAAGSRWEPLGAAGSCTIFKNIENPYGKLWILSHQRAAKRLKIAEEDDKIVEKELAAGVPRCFSKATLLCIDFQKNAKQLPIRAGSCFYGVQGVKKGAQIRKNYCQKMRRL